MTQSLYERLGGSDAISQVANDVVDNHMNIRSISNHIKDANISALKDATASFFITGTGGQNLYKGKSCWQHIKA
ncbi:MAG: hypothetical protein OEZ38_14455 [Gammaproteobacteria bacterium]|nr:hypothetical protein [Gammaproteobacteria bacterium]